VDKRLVADLPVCALDLLDAAGAKSKPFATSVLVKSPSQAPFIGYARVGGLFFQHIERFGRKRDRPCHKKVETFFIRNVNEEIFHLLSRNF
jgi:hypothetical protein